MRKSSVEKKELSRATIQIFQISQCAAIIRFVLRTTKHLVATVRRTMSIMWYEKTERRKKLLLFLMGQDRWVIRIITIGRPERVDVVDVVAVALLHC